MTGWDWDGEGFGNPRIRVRSGWSASAEFGNIDIGFDEIDELIMAGYVNGTRMFTPEAPNASVAPHVFIYFFNLIGNGPFVRPVHNALIGDQFDWFDHKQGILQLDRIPIPGADNYCIGHLYASALRPYLGSDGYGLFMRGLECDWSGHLAMDLHPYWGAMFMEYPLGGFFPDRYASNPYHSRTARPSLAPETWDNPALFHNVGWPTHNSPTGLFFAYHTTFVAEATMHPPGTFPQGGTYLVAPFTQFGPLGACTNSPTYDVGLWGYGDSGSGCPDGMPPYTAYPWGIRINCEVGPGYSNVQTFLAVNRPEPGTRHALREPPGQPGFEVLQDMVRNAVRHHEER